MKHEGPQPKDKLGKDKYTKKPYVFIRYIKKIHSIRKLGTAVNHSWNDGRICKNKLGLRGWGDS